MFMNPDGGYPVSAEAIEPSVLLSFDSDVMRGVLRGSVGTCFRVFASLSNRLRHQVDEIEKLALHSAVSRLADYLVEHCAARQGHGLRSSPPGTEARHRGAPGHSAGDVFAGGRASDEGTSHSRAGTEHRAARRRWTARARARSDPARRRFRREYGTRSDRDRRSAGVPDPPIGRSSCGGCRRRRARVSPGARSPLRQFPDEADPCRRRVFASYHCNMITLASTIAPPASWAAPRISPRTSAATMIVVIG